MVLALLIGTGVWFVAGDLFLGVKVFGASVLIVAVAITVATVRDLRRLFSPKPGRKPFRWVPLALADFAICALALASANWWLGEEARGPALAEGMWWTRDCCNVDSAYDARLRQTFPTGSSEQRLRETLAGQGFEFPEDGRAVAHWSDLACSYFADVEWNADEASRLTTIKGDVGSSCL